MNILTQEQVIIALENGIKELQNGAPFAVVQNGRGSYNVILNREHVCPDWFRESLRKAEYFDIEPHPLNEKVARLCDVANGQPRNYFLNQEFAAVYANFYLGLKSAFENIMNK